MKPIIFSGWCIPRLQDRTKTQTRRVVSARNGYWGWTNPKHHEYDWSRAWADPGLGSGGYLHVPCRHKEDSWEDDPADDTADRFRCRWRIGDLLWVKETLDGLMGCDATYCADDERLVDSHPDKWDVWRDGRSLLCKTVPSIFMPRWASRITLRVEDVRVQRLWDISEAEAVSEGCIDGDNGWAIGSPMFAFIALWDSINGKKAGCAWKDSPWVWALTFSVVDK